MHERRYILLSKLNNRDERTLEECRHDRSQVRTNLPILTINKCQRPRNRIKAARIRPTGQVILLLLVQALKDRKLKELRGLVLRNGLYFGERIIDNGLLISQIRRNYE